MSSTLNSRRMLRAIPAAVLLALLSVPGQAQTSRVEGEVNSWLASAANSLSYELAFSATVTSPRTAQPGGAVSVTTETVKLTASDKVVTNATFYVPKKSKERNPAAILVHDAGSSGEALAPIAKYLNKQGFGVLVLDLRGHGKSVTKELDWTKLDEEARERLWATALNDVQAGAEWLRKRRDIHSSNLTVVGVRAGCALAARHAVDDENARAAVLIAPEAHSLGFNVLRDLRSLGGLPTLMLCEKAGRQEAVRMCEASHTANGGQEYIEVKYIKCKSNKLMSDSKLKRNMAVWLREQVMPRRGR